jgi:uncharacterized protein (DUF427 family)
MSIRMLDMLQGRLGELRHEQTEKWVRASFVGRDVLDSRRALLVWEPRRVVPSYAVPAEDIRAATTPALREPAEVPDGVLHPGVPFAAHTAPGRALDVGDRPAAGFALDDAALDGYIVLDFTAFDRWLEEDQPVESHAVDPFHRVDLRRSSRHVRIEIDGEPIAETSRPVLLFETSLPTRFYVPLADVDAELIPSDLRTRCPFKGRAAWWSVEAAGRRHADIGWTYQETLPETVALRDHVAFWDERVDVIVDGVPRERPTTAVSKALLDEVGA